MNRRDARQQHHQDAQRQEPAQVFLPAASTPPHDPLSAAHGHAEAATRAGPRLRHLHDVLQGSLHQGVREAGRRVVQARGRRQGLRHLRGPARVLPQLLLPVDAGRALRPGMEAREGEVRDLHPAERRQHPGRRRSELPERVDARAVLFADQEMGARGRAGRPLRVRAHRAAHDRGAARPRPRYRPGRSGRQHHGAPSAGSGRRDVHSRGEARAHGPDGAKRNPG